MERGGLNVTGTFDTEDKIENAFEGFHFKKVSPIASSSSTWCSPGTRGLALPSCFLNCFRPDAWSFSLTGVGVGTSLSWTSWGFPSLTMSFWILALHNDFFVETFQKVLSGRIISHIQILGVNCYYKLSVTSIDYVESQMIDYLVSDGEFMCRKL